MKRGGYIKRNVRPRARSKTKHKPSVLRPNKWIRLTAAEMAAIRAAKMTEQNGRCAKCQRCLTSAHLHHKKFRSQGGLDVAENLELLCPKCHGKAHGITVIEH